MKKRNILTVALALCLIAIMACGTLAYFTDRESVTNIFQTSFDDATDKDGDGDIDDDDIKDSIFSIVVYETDNTKTDGSKTFTGNTYDAILPGDTLAKDPTVENTGAYPAYIRVTVVVNKATEWKNAIAKHIANGNIDNDKLDEDGNYNLEKIFEGFEADKWERVTDPEFAEIKDPADETTVVDTTLTYVYYLKAELPAEDDTATTVKEDAVTLFTDVVIPEYFDVDDMLSLKDFEVEITADAIQTNHTGDPDGKELDSYYAFKNFWKVNN